MDQESTPLLKTKLYLPPPRPHLVARPRLAAQMDEALHLQHRLVLIAAPAGSGKTTLVSEWLHRQTRPRAWLSLDAKDNDAQRFLSYLVEAMRLLGISTGHTELAGQAAQDLPPAEAVITPMINAISASAKPCILVLDDYHLIENDWIHQAIGFLVEYAPPELHLILTTRVDPPLPLAQLRARGQLTELRDHDLRFSPEETAALLNQVMELELPAEAVATIGQLTEGWIAGLQMAAISARGHKLQGDLGAFIASFDGTNRFILDYLMDEVLNQQTPAVQEFLIETSILEQMCGGLCDAVRGAGAALPDSQSILDQLERANLFVISLDDRRHWYRYHHLFADLLQSILRRRRSAAAIHELHRRAGRWYHAARLPVEAITHFLAAQEFEQAAALIDENLSTLLNVFARNQAPLLLSWIAQLPDEVRHSRPWIDIYRANMLALNLQPDEVEPILAEVEQRVGPGAPRAAEMQGHIAAIRAFVANLQGDIAHALALGTLAKQLLPGGEYTAARGTAAYALADTYFAADDMESAAQAQMELLEVGEKAGQLMMVVAALCDLAAVRRVQGRLHEAEALYARAYQWMAERNGLDSRVRCSYEFGLANLLRERNQLDAAYEHVMTGIEYRRRLGAYKLIGELALMRVLQARGEAAAALQALRDAEQVAQTLSFQMGLLVELRTAAVRQWLSAGDVSTASRWAEQCRGGSEREQIAWARLWLAQGHPEEACRLLERQAALAEAGGRSGRLIEILCLHALALAAQGDHAQAEERLSQAIALAKSEGYLRVFLDMGRPLRALLERMAGRDAGGDVRALLDAFRQEPDADGSSPPPSGAQTLIEPLTGRELEVLRLLAEGLSNKEMAGRLVVTPGTVKQHLKNIARKLDVHGRMQAVRRGRELDLL